MKYFRRLRRIRPYGKKRGLRRSGSESARALGYGVLAAAAFLIGMLAEAVIFLVLLAPQWRVNHDFVETDSIVLAKRATPHEEGGFLPEVHVEYEAGGQRQRQWTYDVHRHAVATEAEALALIDQFAVGEEAPCWYDPYKPSRVVLVRGRAWWVWLIAWLPAPFIVAGLGGLALTALGWGRSVERRSVERDRGAGMEVIREISGAEPKWPTVPSAEPIANSPGVHLAYRLPVAGDASMRIAVIGFVCLAWNVFAAMLLTSGIVQWASGDFNPRLWGLAAVLVAIGAGLAFRLVSEWTQIAARGATRIEVDGHPFRPGVPRKAHLSQTGRARFQYLEAFLSCTETAVYKQGTDVRSESRVVFQQRCFFRTAVQVEPSLGLEEFFDVTPPADVMHSFAGRFNRIEWSLDVHGDVEGHGAFVRRFPIIIEPGEPEPRGATAAA